MGTLNPTYIEDRDIFFRKYHSNSLFDSWKQLTDSQKKEYQEIENSYSILADLMSEHYEDLRLYALMYRNVSLYDIDSDPISVLFFASRSNEIIGFKQKLQAEKDSNKAKIAFLFYANIALFPKVVKKYTGINISPVHSTNQSVYLSLLNDFKTGNYRHIFSVSDLSDSDCKVILSKKKNFHSEYLSMCKDCLGDLDSKQNFTDLKDFMTSYFIPLILEDSTLFHNKRRLRYIKINYSKNWKVELIILRKEYDKYIQEVKSYKDERYKLISEASKEVNPLKHLYQSVYDMTEFRSGYEMDLINLKGFKNSITNRLHFLECEFRHRFFYNDYLGLDEKELRTKVAKEHNESLKLKNKIQDLQAQLADIESQIAKTEELKREDFNRWLKHKAEKEERSKRQKEEDQQRLKIETERIDRNLSEAFEQLVLRVKTSDLFKFIYQNHKNIEEYVSISSEKLYNILWIRRPQYMRELESHTTSTNSISYLFYPEVYHRRNAKYLVFAKRNSKFIVRYSALMKLWCELVEAQYKEELRIKKEQKRQAEEARLERTSFNKKNKHHRDDDISFNETLHEYKVKGVALQSVTNFVEGCFPKFDAEFFARKKAYSLGKSPQEILDMWERKGKESRDLGTALHKKIEDYYHEISSPEDSAFKLFLAFADKFKLNPYRTEWAVYDWDAKIAGTIDFVNYQNGEYIIYDWKRSDKLIDNGLVVKKDKYGGKGKSPLEHLDNSTYYHYALQLSIYKYILEKNYGIKISDLRLGVFHPSYDKPYVIRIPYLAKEVNDLFNLRSEVIF